MSLPSHAKFLDKDLNVVATTFINCGWWMSKDLIPKLINDVMRNWPKVNYEPLSHEQFEFIEMYGYRIPRESINQWKRGFWTEVEMMETVVTLVLRESEAKPPVRVDSSTDRLGPNEPLMPVRSPDYIGTCTGIMDNK